MIRFLRTFVLALALSAAGAARAETPPAPFEAKATAAFLVDAETGTVLYEKAADRPFAPAAMAKMMTMAIVFEALKAGRIHLSDTFPVSEHAWRTGGAPSGSATMFAAVKSQIAVSDLVRGAIVQAGNDACLILAEGIAGSEEAFVRLMNDKARALGMAGSVFTNVTGFEDPAQKVTARDMAKLALHLIETYPDYYRIYSEPDFTWNKIYQRNRNPLLGMAIGADGLSTGSTAASGFSLTGSVVRGGHRAVVVVSGLASDAERAAEARRLIEWGFSAYERVRLYEAGEPLGEVRVFGGAEGRVAVATRVPVDLLLMKGLRDQVRARIVYRGPVEAPVAKGQEIGVVRVTVGDAPNQEQAVYALADRPLGTMTQRALDGVGELLLGWW
ncbi:D-alanyl-D-alanine carboxypeptidase family protein [Prosthecomicrobium pneumaticum]|uniref:serine-type D-Ala-D-Ala carboxypeptidase n=1 Tax=Prosthecomicrobium pneumaticum TaxID=81895 RepID=A0A7W9FJ64_9HYPH|nr:D-alanyl-D-alanine carboxypeptidase family protein [Prosthecomicrobium pneumaticum]MBB5751256.1 D-alanyl-D-alanine carboxypeptidase (penicillin-binding protein 5/6) [Prosthecomicrobium pneumaticum]